MEKRMKMLVVVCVLSALVVGGAFALAAYGKARYDEGHRDGRVMHILETWQRDCQPQQTSANFTIGDEVRNTPEYYERRNESFFGVVRLIRCQEWGCCLLINTTEEGCFWMQEDFCQHLVNEVEVNIISAFSVQNYSIRIPLENISVNCTGEDLRLVMGGEAYVCHRMDKPPSFWDVSVCIIFDGDVWVKMDLVENEGYLIYFYYGGENAFMQQETAEEKK